MPNTEHHGSDYLVSLPNPKANWIPGWIVAAPGWLLLLLFSALPLLTLWRTKKYPRALSLRPALTIAILVVVGLVIAWMTQTDEIAIHFTRPRTTAMARIGAGIQFGLARDANPPTMSNQFFRGDKDIASSWELISEQTRLEFDDYYSGNGHSLSSGRLGFALDQAAMTSDAGPKIVLHRASIAAWLINLILVAICLWMAVPKIRRMRRAGKGLCVECGYDIRASSERCSECGAPIPSTKAAQFNGSLTEE